jgi:hypothetical protein
MRQASLGLGNPYARKPPSLLLCIFGRWLHGTALAVWLGGLVMIGAVVAPTVFQILPHDPTLAGGIVGDSLRVFNIVCLVCGGLMLLADVLLWRTWRGPSAFSLIVTLGLIALTVYLGWILFPQMDAAQAHHQLAVFAPLHARYERLSLWELPPLLCLLLADALRGGSL